MSRLQIFLSLGFRPFFLGAGAYAAIALLIWLVTLGAPGLLPVRTIPLLWHVHEMLFGYLAAVIAGFLLTAVPNWTQRPPVTGLPLGGLFLVWLAGRVVNGLVPVSIWTALLDCLMFVLLAAYLWVQITASRNHRNLVIAAVISLFALAHCWWYWELLRGGYPAGAMRITLAALACLLTIVGGRLVPNFSRNWLVARGASVLPQAADRFDSVCVLLTVTAVALWCVAPLSQLSGVGLVIAGVMNVARLARWRGWTTLAEPLIVVLHLGYLWLPVAFGLLGMEILYPGIFRPGAGTHALTAGAAGTMTVAVMTRATLGHSGRPLTADRLTVVIYALIIAGALIRVTAPWLPVYRAELYVLAGLSWAAGFGLFCATYGRYFLTERVQAKPTGM